MSKLVGKKDLMQEETKLEKFTNSKLQELFKISNTSMEELATYYEAFTIYHFEALESIKENANDFKLSTNNKLTFIEKILKHYFDLYSAITDEYKYRVCYDFKKPKYHFRRSYHDSVTSNFEYNMGHARRKKTVSEKLEATIQSTESTYNFLFAEFNKFNRAEKHLEGLLLDFFRSAMDLYNIKILPDDIQIERTNFR
jgi:hypothetical protein